MDSADGKPLKVWARRIWTLEVCCGCFFAIRLRGIDVSRQTVLL